MNCRIIMPFFLFRFRVAPLLTPSLSAIESFFLAFLYPSRRSLRALFGPRGHPEPTLQSRNILYPMTGLKPIRMKERDKGGSNRKAFRPTFHVRMPRERVLDFECRNEPNFCTLAGWVLTTQNTRGSSVSRGVLHDDSICTSGLSHMVRMLPSGTLRLSAV